jgi:hypothetical protein
MHRSVTTVLTCLLKATAPAVVCFSGDRNQNKCWFVRQEYEDSLAALPALHPARLLLPRMGELLSQHLFDGRLPTMELHLLHRFSNPGEHALLHGHATPCSIELQKQLFIAIGSRAVGFLFHRLVDLHVRVHPRAESAAQADPDLPLLCDLLGADHRLKFAPTLFGELVGGSIWEDER